MIGDAVNSIALGIVTSIIAAFEVFAPTVATTLWGCFVCGLQKSRSYLWVIYFMYFLLKAAEYGLNLK